VHRAAPTREAAPSPPAAAPQARAHVHPAAAAHHDVKPAKPVNPRAKRKHAQSPQPQPVAQQASHGTSGSVNGNGGGNASGGGQEKKQH
jgi:hypothetical protein